MEALGAEVCTLAINAGRCPTMRVRCARRYGALHRASATWFCLPLTRGPDLPIFAEGVGMVKESLKKLLKLGITKVFPAHAKPFDVSITERRLAAA